MDLRTQQFNSKYIFRRSRKAWQDVSPLLNYDIRIFHRELGTHEIGIYLVHTLKAINIATRDYIKDSIKLKLHMNKHVASW